MKSFVIVTSSKCHGPSDIIFLRKYLFQKILYFYIFLNKLEKENGVNNSQFNFSRCDYGLPSDLSKQASIFNNNHHFRFD